MPTYQRIFLIATMMLLKTPLEWRTIASVTSLMMKKINLLLIPHLLEMSLPQKIAQSSQFNLSPKIIKSTQLSDGNVQDAQTSTAKVEIPATGAIRKELKKMEMSPRKRESK